MKNVSKWCVVLLAVTVLFGCANKEKAINRKVKQLEDEAGLAIKTQNYELAEQKFSAILELKPDAEHVKNNLAILYAQFLGKQKKAVELWEELIKTNPKNAAYYNNVAGLYWAEQSYDKALQYYQESIKYHPSYHMPFYNMAQIYMEMNNMEKAEEMAIKGYNLAPNDARMNLVYAKVLLIVGKRAEALAVTEKLRSNYPNVLLNNLEISRIHIGDGDYEQAEALLNESLAEFPQNDLLLAELVELGLARGDEAEATDKIIQQLEASQARIFQGWYTVLYNARLTLKNGDPEKAIEQLNGLSGVIPKELYYFEGLRLIALSEAMMTVGREDEAAKLRGEALLMCPERLTKPALQMNGEMTE
ncbi:MAG TPA: tetratricopeptide repeat protein [bacterium]|nr:tetratricopeptide repeat protein [bacterium]